MGKALIIKNADFSANSIGSITELYEDITDSITFVQGLVSRTASTDFQAQLFNSTYNATSALIPRYITFQPTDSTLYDTSDKGMEWFIPAGLKVNGFVYNRASTVGSNGKISNSYSNIPTISGSGVWITGNDIYQLLGVSRTTYPCYAIALSRDGSTESLTFAQAKTMGLRVRKLRGA